MLHPRNTLLAAMFHRLRDKHMQAICNCRTLPATVGAGYKREDPQGGCLYKIQFDAVSDHSIRSTGGSDRECYGAYVQAVQ